MKSRRVAKLLACVLAVSMSTIPVYATGSATTGSFTGDVTVASPTIKVTVPTDMKVKVQPFYDSAQTNKVTGTGLASDEFVIRNLTSINNTGVKLMCTATAKVTKKATDVQLTYDSSFTPDDSSAKKKAYMALKYASTNVQVSQNSYDSTDFAPVTLPGSRLQFVVPAPTGSGLSTSGNGAFAVMGKANVGADWKDGDLGIAITYDIKTTPSSVNNGLNGNVLNAVTITSANVATQDTVIADTDQLDDDLLKGAKITAVQLHAVGNEYADISVPVTEKTKISVEYSKDNAGNQIASVKFPKGSPTLVALTKNYYEAETQIIIALDDGRRLVVESVTIS